jgi:hypothetical protein
MTREDTLTYLNSSGKSTTLGVLTRGGLDDGRGRARVGLFRHKHEFESGRTSSVGMEVCFRVHFFASIALTSTSQILGFSADGLPILPTTHFSNEIDVIRREKLGWDEISKQSAKIVSFIGTLIIVIRFTHSVIINALQSQTWQVMNDISRQPFMVCRDVWSG